MAESEEEQKSLLMKLKEEWKSWQTNVCLVKARFFSEQDPVSLSVSLSHQEASISLLSFIIRRQADQKPQS